MTRVRDEGGRSPRIGGYYWFPAPAGDAVAWSVLTCHDLGQGPEEGHSEMWPSVIDRLATAWGRDALRLGRLLAEHCYGLPRGRVTRPGRRFLVLHGDDAPVGDWPGRVAGRFGLDRRSLRLLLDEHERTFTQDRRAVSEELGIPIGPPGPEGTEAPR